MSERKTDEQHSGGRAGGEEHAHPKDIEYIKVAIVLAVVTAVEVAVYYIEAADALVIPLLFLFGFIKFTLVVLWFMHLKFDSPTYGRFFVVGLAFAVTLYIVVLISLGVFAG